MCVHSHNLRILCACLWFGCVCNICRPHVHQSSISLPCYSASPLARRVVDLIALAPAYRDGVEGLEGAQADAGDGHEAGGKHDQDGLGVVEGHGQVVAHWDHQWVGTAAEAPLACGEDIRDGGDKNWGEESRGKEQRTEGVRVAGLDLTLMMN